MATEWWSIEVFSAQTSAAAWRDAHSQSLIESALTNGASAWEWHDHSWGVVFEVEFADEEQWQAWRALPGTRAALDSVPDPVNGLMVYRGRGGSSGRPVPRGPEVSPGAASVELPEPEEAEALVDLGGAEGVGRPGEPAGDPVGDPVGDAPDDDPAVPVR